MPGRGGLRRGGNITEGELAECSEQSAFGALAEALREELDDHREAINESTVEIQTVYEFLNELDEKIDKVQAMVEQALLAKGNPSEHPIQPLTRREKSVCQAIYYFGQTAPWVGYDTIAKRTQLPKDALAAIIGGVAAKGVPILKKYDRGNAYVQFSPEFRELQAKKNIIKADTTLTHWLDQEEECHHQPSQPSASLS